MEQDDLSEHFPLIDATDHSILMHRDAHFGGDFSIMLDYYKQDGKGVQEDFNIERIEELAKLEKELKQNIAAIYLSMGEAQKIAESRKVYKQLRQIYEIKKARSIHPQLIADLILTEDKEAKEEIKAIVAEKDLIVPFLIELLRNEDFYDPLFPGYGLAPGLAVEALGYIGDKRAIFYLFEALGQGDFFADDQILKALKMIGEPAKQFLLKVVKGRPINEDNERAAIGLIQFKDDPEVALTCFQLLKDPAVQRDPCLPTYLALACEGLDLQKRKEFIEFAKDNKLPKQLKEDMKTLIHAWSNSEGTEK